MAPVRYLLNAPLLLFLVLIVGLPQQTSGRMGASSDAYAIMDRELQTKEISVEDLESFMLSFSFNSPPKELTTFWLELFETPGSFETDPSLKTIQTALEAFLVQEMNSGPYSESYDSVSRVKATVLSQSMLTSSQQSQQTLLGSELQTQVHITFRNEPSPDVTEVESAVLTIMEDLTGFVAILKQMGAGDESLKDINSATRRENGSTPEDDIGDNIITPDMNRTSTASSNPLKMEILIPVLAGGCLLLAMIALFAVRRKKTKRIFAITNSNEISTVNNPKISVFMGDEDSDVFSYEAALDDESPTTARRNARSRALMDSSDEEDANSDIFSGIGSPTRSVYSFTSGYRSEASTVVVSNTFKNRSAASESVEATFSEDAESPAISAKDTPHSKLSSLFTFSEEDEGDLDSGAEDGLLFCGKPQLTKTTNNERTPEAPDAHKHFTSASAAQKDGAQTSSHSESDTDAAAIVANVVGVISRTDEPHSEDEEESTAFGSMAKAESTGSYDAPDPSPGYGDAYSPDKESATGGEAAALGISMFRVPRDTGAHSDSETKPETERHQSSRKKGSYGYDSDPGPRHSGEPSEDVEWDNPLQSSANAAKAAEFVKTVNETQEQIAQMPSSQSKSLFRYSKGKKSHPELSHVDTSTSSSTPNYSSGRRKGRRHAKATTADGSTDYQKETMQQRDETLASFDAVSLSDTEMSGSRNQMTPHSIRTTPSARSARSALSQAAERSLYSMASMSSEDNNDPMSPRASSDASASRKLLSDLVWLENKIADVTSSTSLSLVPPSVAGPEKVDQQKAEHPGVEPSDSLSFASGDGHVSAAASEDHQDVKNASIICRDCFAPPGKLRIVIHSTKDGPAIHTVKRGSSLEGHVHPGDLIISVDNVDTRSHTAEQVMKLMTARTKHERKITVLHFENNAN